MIELRRDAQEVREIEVTEPHAVDAIDGRDRVDVLQTDLGLDLADHEGARMRDRDLLGDRPGHEVVVRRAERRAAPAGRWIARPLHDVARLLDRLDHRHHHADGAGIEHARDVLVGGRRHPHERHDVETAAQRDLRLDRLEADAAVLHVEQHELGAGRVADLRQARRHELPRHRAEACLAAGEFLLHRITTHVVLLPTFFGPGRWHHGRLRRPRHECVDRTARLLLPHGSWRTSAHERHRSSRS